MDKMTTMAGAAACRRLKEAMEGVLAPLGEELGVKFDVGRMTYTRTNVKVLVEAAIVAPDGTAQMQEVEWFKLYARQFGLEPEDLGRKFLDRGDEFEIIGLRPAARRMPIMCRRVKDGKEYKYTAITVKAAINKLKGAPNAKRSSEI